LPPAEKSAGKCMNFEPAGKALEARWASEGRSPTMPRTLPASG